MPVRKPESYGNRKQITVRCKSTTVLRTRETPFHFGSISVYTNIVGIIMMSPFGFIFLLYYVVKFFMILRKCYIVFFDLVE